MIVKTLNSSTEDNGNIKVNEPKPPHEQNIIEDNIKMDVDEYSKSSSER